MLTRLPNGLTVYILKDTRFPLVCTRLYVRTGSANEEPRHAGISHVLEHMVFKGTEHRPKGQVAREVEALGGYLNAATSFDKTWYLTDMPAAHWRTGMDVVKDMAFQARLDPKELEAEKNVVISELQRGEDSPMRKLYENLQVAGLKNTPYGRPIIGYVDTIKAITAQDLRDYVKRWYQPQNMMLLVAGDIEPDAVLACVGGGSNAIGMFHPFLEDADVRLVGVEAAGTGETGCFNSAPLNLGTPGVLHGNYSMLLQNNDGQIEPSHSISAGLDYPGVGPEHAFLHKSGRVHYGMVKDANALAAFLRLCRSEGILPALESSHALAWVLDHPQEFTPGSHVVVNLSGRGDKDMDIIRAALAEKEV